METATIAPAMPYTAATTGRQRITSIDFLRGLVMIIMALDHTRDFFHEGAMTADPLDLSTTTPFLFFTRWITHFCAPVFVFLAGSSAFLQSLRKPTKELSAFLVKRGLWLVFVEVAIVNLGITFDISYSIFFLQTIWAIGISMVVLGLAIWLPFAAIFALGLAIVLGHNALDFNEKGKDSFGVFYSFLHRQSFFPLVEGHNVMFVYPVLPWIGLMMLGYCFGKLYHLFDGSMRRKVLAILGIGVILFFVSLRWANIYGDPQQWQVQNTGMKTFLSFINTTKYPPSLLYTCMTIGPAILLLAFAEKWRNRLTRIVTVYGKVPFFYYILHFYLIHLVTSIMYLARGHSFQEGASGANGLPFRFVQPGEGLSLPETYLVWIGIVVVLYPVCLWFSRYKQRNQQWWLSYL